ncbi:hypothetical protein L195_g033943 [Trifolium pratense]|uniref:RNase H type-1 domain-containing protein n=1 Tax=Trifolium pratense TaxID=57577 RepID=A0A2K3LHF8_TRIPR|nr:hypothetical protein L195_g033943 [Trifolium pratense]
MNRKKECVAAGCKENGEACGKFEHRRKSSIYFGGYVATAFQLERGFDITMFSVRQAVNYAVNSRRMRHIFFDCIESKDSWAAAQLSSVLATRLQHFNNVKEVIFDICRKETKEVAGRVAVMIWVNNWLWNHDKSGAIQMGMLAFNVWKDWYLAQYFGGSAANNEQIQQQYQWQPPQRGWVKCNVDAGFHNGGRTINIFESDSQTVVRALQTSYGGVSMFSVLISSIKNMLPLNSNFDVKFIKRQANSVAHKLARVADS